MNYQSQQKLNILLSKIQNENNDIFTSKESFLIVLDSRNATTYNNGDLMSDITFDLQDAIQIDPKTTIECSITVLSFVCPVSFYQINNTNNILMLSIANVIHKILIPYGNYNSSTFINYFKTLSIGITIVLIC